MSKKRWLTRNIFLWFLIVFSFHFFGEQIIDRSGHDPVFEVVKQYLPDNPIVVDAGAFDGGDSLRISQLWPNGLVYAFEPDPRNVEKLLAKVQDQKNVEVYPLALGATNGMATFYQSYDPECQGNYQSGSLLAPKDHLKYSRVTFDSVIEVPTITLDTWAQENHVDHVDFLWLDLQGSELAVLKSAQKLIQQVRVIYTEVEFVEAYKNQALYNQVRSWLENQGFVVVAKDFDESDASRWYGNIILVKKDYLEKKSEPKVKIAFFINQLSFQGTEVALYDYAHFNEEILCNQSVIINYDVGTYNEVRDKFEHRFGTRFYDCCTPEQINDVLLKEKVDIFYIIKPCRNYVQGIKPYRAKKIMHAVFTECIQECLNDPYCSVYAADSTWLSRQQKSAHFPVVPHIVYLPEEDESLRAELAIPENAIVFGCHGGADSFNIEFVKQAVKEVANTRQDIYFLFLGIEPFCSASNVIFLPATSDMKYKTRFINTCDAMIHARLMGESFGLSCGEFSIKNKPVITWADSFEQAHIEILGDKGIYYRTKEDVFNIFMSFQKTSDTNWDAYSQKFNPYTVMQTFDELFIKPCLDSKAREENNQAANFALAGRFEDHQQWREAHDLYLLAASQKADAEMSFLSLYKAAEMAEKIDDLGWIFAQDYYFQAYATRPIRAEPLVRLADHYFMEKLNHHLSFFFARQALEIPYPYNEKLFVDRYMYDFKRYDIIGVVAWYLGEFELGERSIRKALENFPDNTRLKNNLEFYLRRKDSH